jgi:hypothetical protein
MLLSTNCSSLFHMINAGTCIVSRGDVPSTNYGTCKHVMNVAVITVVQVYLLSGVHLKPRLSLRTTLHTNYIYICILVGFCLYLLGIAVFNLKMCFLVSSDFTLI